MSISRRYTSSDANSLGIAFETTLAFNPIVFSTPKKVFSGSNLDEEVTSVEVTVRVSKRGIETVARLGQDDELQESTSGVPISSNGR